MNNVPDIEGKWFGRLSYGPEYGPELHGQTLDFEIVFTKSAANDGTFTALARDIGGFQPNPTKAHVEGFVEHNLISFTKLYEQQFMISETGETVISPVNIPIEYSARYNPEFKKFIGEWIMCHYIKEYNGFVQTYELTGLWEMSKANLAAV